MSVQITGMKYYYNIRTDIPLLLEAVVLKTTFCFIFIFFHIYNFNIQLNDEIFDISSVQSLVVWIGVCLPITRTLKCRGLVSLL